MFSSIVFIAGLVMFFLIIGLRTRVAILENMLKKGLPQVANTATNQSGQQTLSKPNIQGSVKKPENIQQPLIDFINAHLGHGTNRVEITKMLLANSWTAKDIQDAFNYIDLSSGGVANVSQNTEIDSTMSVINVEPDWSTRFAEWVKEDWLMKLGALLLLIGFGWLTSYAFIHDIIGPRTRIALGISAGTLFIVLGWWRTQKYIHQGGVFMVIGSTAILLTVFAARSLYGFFTPMSALGIMFLSTAFVAIASVKYNNRALGLASIILAGFAPLLTGSQSTDIVSLFSYLLVVTIGTVWIVVMTGRRELTAASLIIVALYSLPHLANFNSPDNSIILMFIYVFAVIFFITNTAGILKIKGKDIMPDLVTAAGNGMLLLIWIMSAAPVEWKSLIISGWMVIFVVCAFVTYKLTMRKEAFLVYVGIGVAMLAAATSVELSGASLTIAFIAEAALLSLVTYALLQDSKIATKVSMLLIVPVIMSIQSIASPAWINGVIHKDFFVILIMAITLLGLGAFFIKASKQANDEDTVGLNTAMLVVGSLYAYVLIWLSLHAAIQSDTPAVMISLFIYTLIGLISYFTGLNRNSKGLKVYGGALLGFVVIRLLLVDVWSMELAGRIITFFIIGTLLVATAFLGKKNKSTNQQISQP